MLKSKIRLTTWSGHLPSQLICANSDLYNHTNYLSVLCNGKFYFQSFQTYLYTLRRVTRFTWVFSIYVGRVSKVSLLITNILFSRYLSKTQKQYGYETSRNRFVCQIDFQCVVVFNFSNAICVFNSKYTYYFSILVCFIKIGCYNILYCFIF